MLHLRKYQTEALEAIESEWSKGIARTVVVLPTGMGKTVIFAHLVKSRAHLPGKSLILVHRDELVNQAADKIKSVAPELTVGVVKAERREVDAEVIIGSVQTLARANRREQIPDVSMIIVDECHHAAARSYVDIMEHFGSFDIPGDIFETAVPTVGFTATLDRNDKLSLGSIWQSIAYQKDILFGVTRGHLANVKGKSVTLGGLDLGNVARSRGDYQAEDLGGAMIEAGAGAVIAEAYHEHAAGRQGLLFAPNVASTYLWSQDLNRAGITSIAITGETPYEDRQLAFKRYREGEIQVLSNCMVLTEGFDMPQASVAVIARPTTSASLYIQMVGRVLRPWPGKDHALVLDVVGATARHKLAGLVDLVGGGVDAVNPDELLTEAVERDEKEKEYHSPVLTVRPDGEITSEDVDLFLRSTSAWLQTRKGVWFIPVKEAIWFLWPEKADDGTFAVGRYPTGRTSGGAKISWPYRHMTLEYGMSWAEEAATTEDESISGRSSFWRKKKAKPSDAQIRYAHGLGITEPDTMSKAELSDQISIVIASRLLDVRLGK